MNALKSSKWWAKSEKAKHDWSKQIAADKKRQQAGAEMNVQIRRIVENMHTGIVTGSNKDTQPQSTSGTQQRTWRTNFGEKKLETALTKYRQRGGQSPIQPQSEHSKL